MDDDGTDDGTEGQMTDDDDWTDDGTDIRTEDDRRRSDGHDGTDGRYINITIQSI